MWRFKLGYTENSICKCRLAFHYIVPASHFIIRAFRGISKTKIWLVIVNLTGLATGRFSHHENREVEWLESTHTMFKGSDLFLDRQSWEYLDRISSRFKGAWLLTGFWITGFIDHLQVVLQTTITLSPFPHFTVHCYTLVSSVYYSFHYPFLGNGF
jgi:hypothetical protein